MDVVNDFFGLFMVIFSFSYFVFLAKRFFSWMEAVESGKISSKNRSNKLYWLLWTFFLRKSS